MRSGVFTPEVHPVADLGLQFDVLAGVWCCKSMFLATCFLRREVWQVNSREGSVSVRLVASDAGGSRDRFPGRDVRRMVKARTQRDCSRNVSHAGATACERQERERGRVGSVSGFVGGFGVSGANVGAGLLFGYWIGVSFRWGLLAGREEAAADIAFKEVGLFDRRSGFEEAGGGVGRGHGLAVG